MRSIEKIMRLVKNRNRGFFLRIPVIDLSAPWSITVIYIEYFMLGNKLYFVCVTS